MEPISSVVMRYDDLAVITAMTSLNPAIIPAN